jgi:hypothetical protein
MDSIQTRNRNLEAIAWGALFIWWGVTELVQALPDGVGAIGIGLILLGLNAARRLNSIAASGFTTIMGVLAVLWGSLDLAGALLSLPFKIPVFAILLVVLGVIVLVGELKGAKVNEQRN